MNSPGRQVRSDFVIGIVCLLSVVILWSCKCEIASSFLTSSILKGVEEPYDKPWLVTWLCTSSFALYLIKPAYGRASLRFRKRNPELANTKPPGYETYHSVSSDDVINVSRTQDAPLTVAETWRLAAWFCAAWFAANWSLAGESLPKSCPHLLMKPTLQNAALSLTSVSSATILTSTSGKNLLYLTISFDNVSALVGFFTLALGRLVRVETFTWWKLLAIATSIAGVVLVSKSDHEVSERPNEYSSSDRPLRLGRLGGDLLAVLSAVLYACYIILLKKGAGDKSRISMPLLFGFTGVINILFLWPFAFLLHFTGLELIEVPRGARLQASLLLNALITLHVGPSTSDYLYMVAMLKTSPLIVTLGMSLTIPLGLLGDFFLGTRIGGIQVFAGAVLVLASFAAVGYGDRRQTRYSESGAEQYRDARAETSPSSS